MTLRRRDDLRTSPWADDGGGGLAVYDPGNDAGYLLDATNAVVFEACDGQTSRDELANRITARTGRPATPALVDRALADLCSSGLLEETVVPDAPKAGGANGLSRRALLGRAALGVGVVAVLPAIDMVGGVSRLAADPRSGSNAPQNGIPPLIAQDKSATTPEGTPVGVTLTTTGGFVTPDSTAFMVQTEPSHGTVELVGAVATYKPAPGFVGTDTFTYLAWQCVAFVDAVLACPDGTGPFPESGSDPATVTITVTAPSSSTTTGVAPTTEAKPAVQSSAAPRFTG